MSVDVDNRIPEVSRWFRSRARSLVEDTAETAQGVARMRARKRTGAMAQGIIVQPTIRGFWFQYLMIATMFYSVYHEYGTGIYATGPGGSRAEEIPWVYFDEYLGHFVTTYGVTPEPFMRPGYEAGKAYLNASAARYF